MSIIQQVKGLVISNLEAPKELKEVLLKFLNELDSDLDVGGYVPSSDVDRAILELDAVLVTLDDDQVEPNITEVKEDDEDLSAFQGREISTDDDTE